MGETALAVHGQGSPAATLLLHPVMNTAMDAPLAGRALGRTRPLSTPPVGPDWLAWRDFWPQVLRSCDASSRQTERWAGRIRWHGPIRLAPGPLLVQRLPHYE